MRSLDEFFSKQEQGKLLKALEEKDYETLTELINDNEEKAKIVFSLQQEITKLNELDAFFNKTSLAEKLADKKEQVKKIIIELKGGLKLITGQGFLKPAMAISGWHRSNQEKVDALHFNKFTISKKADSFVFSRDKWFKKLIIKNNNPESSLEEKKIIRQKNYHTSLAKGSYFVHIDEEEFYLELH